MLYFYCQVCIFKKQSCTQVRVPASVCSSLLSSLSIFPSPDSALSSSSLYQGREWWTAWLTEAVSPFSYVTTSRVGLKIRSILKLCSLDRGCMPTPFQEQQGNCGIALQCMSLRLPHLALCSEYSFQSADDLMISFWFPWLNIVTEQISEASC